MTAVAPAGRAQSEAPGGGRTAIVVAHPDDEALWFSSVLREAGLVLFCFETVPSRADWTAGRRRALAEHPLRSVDSLRLTESETFNGADWREPRYGPAGLAVARRPDSLPGFSGKTYRANFAELVRRLGERLRGFDRVYTHNPWGEYGHEEHVQVYRAVRAVQRALGFELWFDNYASNKSHALVLRYVNGFRSDYVTERTDPALGEELKRFYQRHGCWTWFDDYVWFTHECFQRDREVEEPAAARTPGAGHFFPLNYLRVEAPWEIERPSRWQRMARQLKRLPARAVETRRPG